MSDQILVHETPTPVQIAALLRQGVTVLGTLAGALGYAGVFDAHVAALLGIIGPASVLIAIVWGQLVTRENAKQAAAMASQLPDRVAAFK